MTLDEAIAHVSDGGRATCDFLPRGSVLKLEQVGVWQMPALRVVFEATGDGYNFQRHAELEAAEWRKVEGWLSYGTA